MIKQIGSVYLILGTCIAAGMLGLPIVTAEDHYLFTIVNILSAWLLSTCGAWCLLQVNLSLPAGTNLITMSEKTLGKQIRNLTWAIYLFLLYSLICAYLAASGDVLQGLLADIHIAVPRTFATLLATLLLGGIVYQGIGCVDQVNRILMSSKIIICAVLIGVTLPHSHIAPLLQGDHHWRASSWLVIICSFGYAIILPSIREYLDGHRRQLTRVVLIGSIVPVIFYLIWIAVIQGAVPRTGPDGLLSMNGSANTNTLLMDQLMALTHYKPIKSISVIFIAICSITGLLGVSLCLMDFLADGLKKEKKGRQKLLLAGLTYMPPMLIVILFPEIFTHALAYAGLSCLYVLIALPIAMYLIQRYRRVDLR